MAEYDVSKKLITDYYRSHLDEITAFVSKRMGFSAESEDVVQNIFLRLLESDKMISQVTLPCLVYTIARNMVADYWRHRVSVNEYEHYIRNNVPTSGNSISEGTVYSAFDFNEILERGIARLAVNQRNIYRMNVIGGMKVSEISDCLNESYKSVENRLGIARKVMRSYIRRMMA